MTESLMSIARRFLIDEERVKSTLVNPVLLWTSEAQAPDRQALLGTAILGQSIRPRANDPLVLEIRKPPDSKSAFALGITIGRVKNNDVMLDDDSVSRFHAYFRPDTEGKRWVLVDAESSNGTWVNLTKLKPGQAVTLENSTLIRFGEVHTTFLTPEGLMAHMRKLMSAK